MVSGIECLSWAAMIKLSVSPLSPVLHKQEQLASLSTKGFSRLKKNCCIVFSRNSFILSFSTLSFSITFSDVWAVDKGKYLFIAFVSFRREYFAFPASCFFFYKPAKPVFALLNMIIQIEHGAAVSWHQLNKSPTSTAPLNVQSTNISFQMMKPTHCKKLPSFPINFSISDFLHSSMPKLYVGTGTAKAFIADNLFLNSTLIREWDALCDNIPWLFSPSSQSVECHYSNQHRGICMPLLRRSLELKSYRQLACFGFWFVCHPSL